MTVSSRVIVFYLTVRLILPNPSIVKLEDGVVRTTPFLVILMLVIMMLL